MPNLNAALGCAQLEQAPRFLAAKRALAAAYARACAGLGGLRILPSPPGADSADQAWIDATMQALHDAGLHCRPVWQPLHLLPMYRQDPRSPMTRPQSLPQRLIHLPPTLR